MTDEVQRSLTERQLEVMERIDKRLSIKVIAKELGVSETRINQHIRALKNHFEVESLGDLVEAYRATNAPSLDAEEAEGLTVFQGFAKNLKPYNNPVYSKNQVPEAEQNPQTYPGNDPGELVMSDVLPLETQAPWLRPAEPQVVPRVLDGKNAVIYRLLAIVGIAFGTLAAVVLAVTAAVTISEVLEGRATVPVDNDGFS